MVDNVIKGSKTYNTQASRVTMKKKIGIRSDVLKVEKIWKNDAFN